MAAERVKGGWPAKAKAGGSARGKTVWFAAAENG